MPSTRSVSEAARSRAAACALGLYRSPRSMHLDFHSKEETKSKSIFQKIETKLGLHDDKQQKEKADKLDKKSLRKPSSRNERDSIMISRPTSTLLSQAAHCRFA